MADGFRNQTCPKIEVALVLLPCPHTEIHETLNPSHRTTPGRRRTLHHHRLPQTRDATLRRRAKSRSRRQPLRQPTRRAATPDGHGGFIPIIIPYRYYYGGWGGYGLGSLLAEAVTSLQPVAATPPAPASPPAEASAAASARAAATVALAAEAQENNAAHPPHPTRKLAADRRIPGPHLPHPRKRHSLLGTNPPPTNLQAAIDTLEAAGNALQEMCLSAAQHIIDNAVTPNWTSPTPQFPPSSGPWNNEPPALYGRFDLSWAGAQSGEAPKLLEYNADTPTSLLEAAVIQWNWLKQIPRPLHRLHQEIPTSSTPSTKNSSPSGGHRPLPLQTHLLRRARKRKQP